MSGESEMKKPRYSEQKSGPLWKIASLSPDECARVWTLLLCAGCVYHLLPPVRCDTDWRRQNVYIPYNGSYFEPQHSLPYRQPHNVYQLSPPYQDRASSYVYNNFVQPRGQAALNHRLETSDVEHLGNSLTDAERDEPLLVGYSHNPYGDSVKSTDFKRETGPRTGASDASPGRDTRGKRGVLHLYNMISCATGCDPVSYKGYGCYCGFLGSGTALDGIDRCCKNHDQCYEDLFCPFFTVYLQPYFWKCRAGRPLCALDNYNTRDQFVHGCAADLCECDRKLAMCLRKYSCPSRRAICTSSPLRLLQNLIMIR